MADSLSQATPFTLILLEQAGDLPPGFVVELEGRSLPYRPIKFTGRQRVKTTWYPGNPVATQQVIGPVEEPTTINGAWKDRYLGNGEAMRLANLFTFLRRSGVLLEVRWGAGVISTQTSVRTVGGVQTQVTDQTIGEAIVRRGIITKTDFTFDRQQDVAWEVEFTWQSLGEKVSPPTFATGGDNPANDFSQMAAAVQGATTAVEDFLDGFRAQAFGMARGVRDAITSPLAVLDTVTKTINATTQVVQTFASLPQSTATNILGLVDGSIRAMDDLIGTFDRFGYQQITPEQNAAAQLVLQSQVVATLRSLFAGKERAVQTRQAILAQTVPTVLAEVRVPAGVDLRDIALQFYGDPDQWPIIAKFNGLSSSRVPPLPSGPSDNPGLPIRVPRQMAGQAATFAT